MRLQRFDTQFLRDFRSPIQVNPAAVAAAQEEAVVPPAPVFSESDLEAATASAKKLGYAEGFEAGLAQAATEAAAREKDAALAIQRMHEQLTQLAGNYQQLVTQQASELSELVLAIAKKVAGEALEARSVDTIVALVARCLPVMFTKPRIAVELHPEMLAKAQSQIEAYLAQQGFEGSLEFRDNETLSHSDVKVDWSSGQAVRSTEQIWQEIETLLHHVPLNPQLPSQTNAS